MALSVLHIRWIWHGTCIWNTPSAIGIGFAGRSWGSPFTTTRARGARSRGQVFEPLPGNQAEVWGALRGGATVGHLAGGQPGQVHRRSGDLDHLEAKGLSRCPACGIAGRGHDGAGWVCGVGAIRDDGLSDDLGHRAGHHLGRRVRRPFPAEATRTGWRHRRLGLFNLVGLGFPGPV